MGINVCEISAPANDDQSGRNRKTTDAVGILSAQRVAGRKKNGAGREADAVPSSRARGGAA
jgi:hypothetical protein